MTRGATVLLGTGVREPRSPVNIAVLRRVRPFLDTTLHDDAMVWSAFTLATFGLLRSGEFALPHGVSTSSPKCLTRNSVAFIAVESTTALRITLRDTKTDHSRNGARVTVGTSGGSVCAVSAMRTYLALRSRLPGIRDKSPLFVFASGEALSQRGCIFILHTLLELAGLSTTGMSGHSFRIGGASDLAAAGVQPHVIRKAGRWSSDSFMRYLRFPTTAQARLAGDMASASVVH